MDMNVEQEQDNERMEIAMEVAFSNHLILNAIFNQLDLASLKTVRQVCHYWLDLSSPILKTNSCLRLRKYKNHYYHLTEFLKSNNKNGEYFVSHVILEHWEIKSSPMDNFFDKVSPWVQELTLYGCSCDLIKEEIKTILPNRLLRKLNQLRRLTINRLNFRNYYDLEQLSSKPKVKRKNVPNMVNPNLEFISINLSNMQNDESFPFQLNWADIFEAFPNLKEFEVYALHSKMALNLVECMSTVRNSNPSRLNLRKLVLNYKPNDNEEVHTIQEHIRQMNFPLEELDTVLQYDKESSTLLTKYSQTLVNLTVDRNLSEGFYRWNLFKIPFRNLRHLEINEIFESFDFLNNIPNLTTLHLICIREESFRYWAQNAIPIPRHNVTSLRIETLPAHLNAMCVDAIIKMFPMLQKLTMVLDDATLRLICSGLQQLIELFILGDLLTDEGICGIDGINGLPVEARNAIDIETGRVHPYIGDLKKLCRFELSRDNPIEITDFSIQFGLTDLLELNFISIPNTLISHAGANLLGHISKKNRRIAFTVEETIQGMELFNEKIDIYGKLVEGSVVTVYGTLHPSVRRISVNLKSGENQAFYFNPRWDQGETIFNSRINGKWGPEEKFFYSQLYPGIEIVVQISCRMESFLVEVNNYDPVVFQYRLPLDTIDSISVQGGIDVNKVTLCL